MKKLKWFLFWVFTGRAHPEHIAACRADAIISDHANDSWRTRAEVLASE
jgi:hypothetical protein